MKQSEAVPEYYDSTQLNKLRLVPKRATRILDIGGGTGATVVELKKRYSECEVVGVVDNSQIAHENRREGLDFHVCANIEQEDVLEDLCKRYGPFDLVLCLDVLEHLVDPWSLMHRIRDLLIPGGVMIACIPNVQHFTVSLNLLFGAWEYRDEGLLDRTHLRFFVKKTAAALVTCSGMQIEATDTTRYWGYRKLAQSIEALSFGKLVGLVVWQYVFRVRKKAT